MIKILVDSASDLELAEAEKLGVTLIPMQVRFGNEEFLDGINLTHKEFFEKLIESDELPQTSQINEFRFEENFKKLTENGDEVIAITISSKLSGTYSCAVKAAKKFGGKVRVVDSLNASIGERVLLQYAVRLLKDGLSVDEIVKELEQSKHKIQVLALLDTLTYLRKGGRISAAAAVAGGILSIKPVVSVIKGEVKLVGKAIGSKKGNNLLNQLVEKCGGIDFEKPYTLGYSGLSDDYLKKYLHDSEKLWKNSTDSVPSYLIGSTIGTHVGPNAIAVAFFAK
ncbi:MAG: DegV family protein [Clostridia bacterium]|nr:DegV family protein [Clostridia bacterium]MDE6355825.1 DegV family protein [Clostridia bacterium]